MDAARLPRHPPPVSATVIGPSNRTAQTNATSPHEEPGPLARVTLVRTDARDARQRQVLVSVDNGPATTLMFGDQQTFEVRPGRHLLKANNTLFWKRMSFVIETGEHIEFQLINRSGRVALGFLALLGVAPLFLSIERRSLDDARRNL